VHKQDPKRATTVPVRKGQDLPRPILRAVIKQAGLTVEEFVRIRVRDAILLQQGQVIDMKSQMCYARFSFSA
jgi:hypothetical protein